MLKWPSRKSAHTKEKTMSEKVAHEKKENGGCGAWLVKIGKFIGSFFLGLVVFWGIYNFFPGTRDQSAPWAAIVSIVVALLVSHFRLPSLKLDNEGLKTLSRPWQFVSPHLWVVGTAYFVLAISIPACAGVTYFATREILVAVSMGVCGFIFYTVPIIVIFLSWKANKKLPFPTPSPTPTPAPIPTSPTIPEVPEENH